MALYLLYPVPTDSAHPVFVAFEGSDGAAAYIRATELFADGADVTALAVWEGGRLIFTVTRDVKAIRSGYEASKAATCEQAYGFGTKRPPGGRAASSTIPTPEVTMMLIPGCMS